MVKETDFPPQPLPSSGSSFHRLIVRLPLANIGRQGLGDTEPLLNESRNFSVNDQRIDEPTDQREHQKKAEEQSHAVVRAFRKR